EYESLVRRILDTLSPRAGIDVSRMTMARLWTILDERERAIDAALLAARSASDANDPVLAAQRMGYVLRTLRRNDDRRIEFRDRQANLLHEAGLYRAAARAYASVVRWGSTPATRAQASARRAMAIVLAGNFDLGRTFALDALELAATVDDPPSRALANEAIGMALARQGRGRDALPYLDAARSGFESAADNLALAHVHQSIGMCMANEGLPDAGDHFRQAISLAEADGNPANLPCLIGLGVLEQRAGRYVSARTLLERARLAAGKNRRLLLEGVARGTLAQLSVYTGHLAEAISLAAETDDLGRHLGDRRLQLVAATARAQALVRCGRTYEASTLLEKRLSAPNLQIDPVMIEAARLARIEAELAANRPEYERLATAISESIARAESLGDPDTLLWARTLEIELRVATDAEGSLERLLHGYESLAAREGSWRQPWFDLRVALARASRGVRRGRAVQSRELLERVIARADELDLPVVRAEAWAVMTRVAQALEDETLARKALDHGRRALDLARERVADDGLSGGLSERTVFQPLREPPPIGDSPINRRLVALYEMIRALNSESDPDQLLETMLDMALEVVGADRGMILLRDQLSGEFAVRVLRNVDHDTIDDGRRFSRHIVAEAAKGKSVIALDAQNDQRFLEWPSVSLHSIQSLMCAPLRSRGHITGAVYLDSREGSRPFDMGSLRFLEAFANHAALALENARQFASLHVQNLDLRAAAEQRATFGSMVGQSSVMQQVFDLIRQVADSELPVLIQGESGTGKELVAQAIHYNGARGKQTFVSENCAAIPDSLLQSELFGHVRGAFTGAEHDRQGLFEQTHGGSLFLDEVGDMSTTMQAQLLRAIQEGEVRRVGSDTPIQVDVRLIAATHR
ncbi:MAG: sigma 54-interacting transcriptional regulator, partial [Acidobacteriota bacterium]|nr:sigma 54-interacting transcriptional regulator [Acidobacteriota bacterium]